MRNSSETAPPSTKSAAHILEVVLWTAFGLFYIYHFTVIYQNALNVPYLDEWDCFPKQPIATWFWTPHNEHLIVTTKLIIWALWRIDGWNFAVHQYVNWALFGILLASLGLFLKRQVPNLPNSAIALLLIWMLSPRMFQNHSWGFQSQWHFMALFLLGTVHFLFASRPEGQRPRDLALGVLFAACCAYSLSTGIFAIAAVGLVFTIFKVIRARHVREKAAREFFQLAICDFCLFAILAVYVLIVRSQQGTPVFTSPAQGEFWVFLFALIGAPLSLPFSASTYVWLGLGILCYHAVPWLWRLFTRASFGESGTNYWSLGATSLALLGVFASIAMGRARLGLNYAGTPRYCEFTMLLVPITVATYWALSSQAIVRRALVTGISAVIFVPALLFSLQYFKFYAFIHDQRAAGREALRQAYAARIDLIVPQIYLPDKPITFRRLEEARELKLSFVDEVTSSKSAGSPP